MPPKRNFREVFGQFAGSGLSLADVMQISDRLSARETRAFRAWDQRLARRRPPYPFSRTPFDRELFIRNHMRDQELGISRQNSGGIVATGPPNYYDTYRQRRRVAEEDMAILLYNMERNRQMALLRIRRAQRRRAYQRIDEIDHELTDLHRMVHAINARRHAGRLRVADRNHLHLVQQRINDLMHMPDRGPPGGGSNAVSTAQDAEEMDGDEAQESFKRPRGDDEEGE